MYPLPVEEKTAKYQTITISKILTQLRLSMEDFDIIDINTGMKKIMVT